jgi:hypothetical protein
MAKKALVAKHSGATSSEVNLKLWARQAMVLESAATEIFFGGAKGGGKSHLIRVAAIKYCTEIPYLQTYIFRRLSPDLKKNHLDGVTGFRSMLEPWVRAGFVEITDDEIRFWNGSKIYLCHCMEEKDKHKYNGCEINLLLMDELTHFTESIYRYLRVNCRLGGLGEHLPKKYKKKFPLIICASNPCNVGHLWVKRTFVDYAEPFQIVKTPAEESGRLRQYIPSTFRDNPSMEENYAETLSGLGDKELIRAYRDGDWDVLSGSFFDSFSKDTHVLKTFVVPNHWQRVLSMDWGWYYPFSIGWWAIAPEDYTDPINNQFIPAGSLVCYREWYGSEGKNVGVKIPPEYVAKKILELQKNDPEPYAYVADPAIWKTDTGLSVGRIFENNGIHWLRGDNKDRARGWMEVERRINESPYPSMYWMELCLDSIRTMASVIRDPAKLEDIDKNCESHCADMVRYLAMFLTKDLPKKMKKDTFDTRLTYNDLFAAHRSAVAKKKNAYNSLIIR